MFVWTILFVWTTHDGCSGLQVQTGIVQTGLVQTGIVQTGIVQTGIVQTG